MPSGNRTRQTLIFTSLDRAGISTQCWRRSGPAEWICQATRSGAHLSWSAFWIQCPKVKLAYRHAEHALQTAEAAATVASLRTGYNYPVQPLYHAWLEMLLNMDRNTLWGAVRGEVFEHPHSWDVCDRFESVEAISAKAQTDAVRAVLGEGQRAGLFNSLNWNRCDPLLLMLPPGTRPAGARCQAEPDGRTLCQSPLPSLGTASLELETAPAESAKLVAVPAVIETKHYWAKIDPATGALDSLKTKPSGREVLSGPVLLVAESGLDAHDTPDAPQRKRLADSRQFPAAVRVAEGPLATVVSVQSQFYGGGKSSQTIHFYKDSPRIDFDTEIHDIPNQTVVVVEFPLAEDIRETRRAIPYGFSHGAWAVPNPELAGWTHDIQAAIRWSHYQSANGGAAILDRGLPGRELNGKTPVLFLLNALGSYFGARCDWLSGKGTHRASYAFVAHEGDWTSARVPQMAWEFNCPPVVIPGVAKTPPASFIQTSENVVVEAARREGGSLELRMVECLGRAGTAWVAVALPHRGAALCDLVGGHPVSLAGGPRYEFPVRPQQIVTLRLATAQAVPEIRPLLKWDELVPPHKLEALKKCLRGSKGCPAPIPHD